MHPSPAELAAMLNDHRGGFDQLIGLRFTSATREEVVAEIEVGPHLTQPFGLVHGGVYASIIETLCSTGAALHVFESGRGVVGLDNQTSFLRAARKGLLTAKAWPLKAGRRTHLWRAEIVDADTRVLASGQVRLIVLEPGEQIAGEAHKTPVMDT